MVSKDQFVALSRFRSTLAHFLRFSDAAARAEGVTTRQYLLLLHLRGDPRRDWATVGELAERLSASHQGTVALVQRCERNRLVAKRRSRIDARRVEIRATSRGRALASSIAARHRGELARLAAALAPLSPKRRKSRA